MATHEESYGTEIVQPWRSAMFEVANLRGFTFKSGSKYEYQTIQKIVQFVNKSLPRYDVFLSFRGMDTRFTFTGHLYNDLCRKGFKTFMDDEAMKYGEQISGSLKTAIEESRVAIIIFSENFAYSTWALEEVAIILDTKKVKNYHVYPVYYKVEPEHVWNQEGSYGEA
ncbi:toll/interleukin-1 receptor-like protein [Arachis hypogaea]|uniref:toll/interleukin-1 receptor-like protein n=1 Tax=Arachis hypogaea TaxID=3818 RepID=UPI003B20E998